MRERSYRTNRTSPGRSLALFAVLVTIAGTLIGLDRFGRLDGVRSQLEIVTSPVLQTLNQVRAQVSDVLGGGNAARLREEIQQLEAENSRLRSENIRALALAQENEQLRRQVRLEQEQPWRLASAPVLAYSPDAGRHLLRIGTGSNDGVRRGMAVVAQDGDSPLALIGVVDEVTASNATVLLIADFTSTISADVFHEGRPVSGMVQGQWQRQSSLRLDQVDRSTPLAAGDVVVTAGLSARLAPGLPGAEVPRNVPIGVVSAARVDGNSQTADLQPFVDPARVRSAWVILSANG